LRGQNLCGKDRRDFVALAHIERDGRISHLMLLLP